MTRIIRSRSWLKLEVGSRRKVDDFTCCFGCNQSFGVRSTCIFRHALKVATRWVMIAIVIEFKSMAQTCPQIIQLSQSDESPSSSCPTFPHQSAGPPDDDPGRALHTSSPSLARAPEPTTLCRAVSPKAYWHKPGLRYVPDYFLGGPALWCFAARCATWLMACTAVRMRVRSARRSLSDIFDEGTMIVVRAIKQVCLAVDSDGTFE